MVSEAEGKTIEEFRDWLAVIARQEVEAVGTVRKVDGEGEHADSRAVRLYTDVHLWLEVNVLPGLSKLRIGLATDDRPTNEDAEQVIEDSRESLDEFLELGLADAGYEDEEGHSMEHFHDSGVFYFATHLDMVSIDSLVDDELREKAKRLVEGYAAAFEELLEND